MNRPAPASSVPSPTTPTSASAVAASPASQRIPRAEPFYFGPDTRPLFGWLHRPERSASSNGEATRRPPPVGVVLCAPFGYEGICAQRSLRHFGESLARAGIPALRFDYDGAGDSAGTDWDRERVASWVRSVRAAKDALRRDTGIGQVVLLGVRLGAALAALAALEQEDVAGFVALAPVISGRAYLRELKALQLALGLAPAPVETRSEKEGVQESIGFPITAETRSDLGVIDLGKLERPPAPAVLLIDRDDFAPNDKWSAHLSALGANVDHQRIAGYVEMMLDPHKALVPQTMIAAVVKWTSALRDRLVESGETHLGDGNTAPSASLATETARDEAEFPSAAGGVRIIERAVFIDRDKRLFGILSQPSPSDTGRTRARKQKAILWLNAGSIGHVGPNRMTVALARKWAGQGHIVLRLDVAGIGESLPYPGAQENIVYTDDSRRDTALALDYLRALGAAEVHAIGLCSGAYNAFKGAVAGQAFDGVVMVNPATFFWKPGMSLDFEYRDSRVRREASRYSKAAFDPQSWLKLVRGKVKLKALAQVLSRRVASEADTRLRRVARKVGRPLKDDLAAELEAVAKKQVGMFFVFADGDPGLELLTTAGGESVQTLRDKRALKLTVIEGPDHTFTPIWAQEKLASILDAHFAGHTAKGA